MTPKATRLTIDDLYLLAQTQPLVHQALVAHHEGGVPLNDMLIGLVMALSEQLEYAQQALYDRYARQSSYHITVTPEQIERFLERAK